MRILLGCEESGIVRREFERVGWDAWSCDILPTRDPENKKHIQADILTVLDDGWDMAIFFPPCTYLSSSGLHWNKRVPGRDELTEQALGFVRKLMSCKAPKWAL